MREVKIKVYKFDELNEDMRKKVIERFREDNDFPFLEDDLKAYLDELLKENNIKNTKKRNLKLYYNLGYAYGDGACFTGAFEYKGLVFYIHHVGRYYTYKDVTIEWDIPDKIIPGINIIDMDFNVTYQEICKKIEERGYANIAHENSKGAILEMIKANEYEFLPDGEIFDGTVELKSTRSMERYRNVVKRISFGGCDDQLVIPEVQVDAMIFEEDDKVKITIEKCEERL